LKNSYIFSSQGFFLTNKVGGCITESHGSHKQKVMILNMVLTQKKQKVMTQAWYWAKRIRRLCLRTTWWAI